MCHVWSNLGVVGCVSVLIRGDQSAVCCVQYFHLMLSPNLISVISLVVHSHLVHVWRFLPYMYSIYPLSKVQKLLMSKVVTFENSWAELVLDIFPSGVVLGDFLLKS